MGNRLHVRWLGRVSYSEADVLQRSLHSREGADYLLTLEHPSVYTLGIRGDIGHIHPSAATSGAQVIQTDRGGDVTYHGPGQLIGYPIISLPICKAGMRDVVAYVRRLEETLIAVLGDFGIVGTQIPKLTGVWVDGASGPKKIAAIGVKVASGRTRHGFALNVDPDLAMFNHIVPCGITDLGVTSMSRELGEHIAMSDVVDSLTRHFGEVFDYQETERHEVSMVSSTSRSTVAAPVSATVSTSAAGPVSVGIRSSTVEAPRPFRPEWMKVKANLGPGYRELKRLVRDLELNTVCEEAGCPNIYECWSERTATFMILGERCTRACGFCLVDTRKPLEVDEGEPDRVADGVARLRLKHAVITCVARDDLADGGAAIFAETVAAIRRESPGTAVELLISDCKGDPNSLGAIFAAAPDVLNHNLETVARLQRSVRPSAGYARSLAVLALARDAGLVTKSGLMVGLGESAPEVRAAIFDLAAVGVQILTIGQYLRPSEAHLDVQRWWTPAEFDALGDYARSLGFAHVESGPLVRSSYHARTGAEVAAGNTFENDAVALAL